MMDDGIVILDGRTIGVFEIELDDRIIVAFENNRSVKDTLEHASENGMTLQLLATPHIDDEEGTIYGSQRSTSSDVRDERRFFPDQ